MNKGIPGLALCFALSFSFNQISGQSFSDSYDAGQDGHNGFSYTSITVQFTKVAEDDFTISYKMNLTGALPDPRGYFYNKYNKYYTCAQIGSFCNPNDFYRIGMDVTYSCDGIKKFAARQDFESLGETNTVVLSKGSNGKKCVSVSLIGINVFSAGFNPNTQGKYFDRIDQLENPVAENKSTHTQSGGNNNPLSNSSGSADSNTESAIDNSGSGENYQNAGSSGSNSQNTYSKPASSYQNSDAELIGKASGDLINYFGNQWVNNVKAKQDREWEKEMREMEEDNRRTLELNKITALLRDCKNAWVANDYKKLFSSAREGLTQSNKKEELTFLAWATIGALATQNFDDCISYGNRYINHQNLKNAPKDDLFLVRFYVGLSYYKKEKYDDAITHLTSAKTLNDTLPGLDKYLGQCFYEKKDFIKAVDHFTIESYRSPKDLDNMSWRAKSKIKLKDYKGAEYDYTRCVEGASDNIQYLEKRALLRLNDLMDYQSALSDYNSLITTKQDNPKYYYNRARCYSNLNDYPSAIKDVNKYIEMNPGASDGYFYRGILYKGSDNSELAIADFTRCIELTPTGAAYYLRRAETYELMQKFELAIADYNSYYNFQQKKVADAFYRIGKIYQLALIDPMKAKPMFEKVAAMDSTSNWYVFSLFHLGQKEKAIELQNKRIAELAEMNMEKARRYYELAALYSLSDNEAAVLANLETAFRNGYNRSRSYFDRDLDFKKMKLRPKVKSLADKYLEKD